MSYGDIEAAKKEREEKDAARAGQRGRKRKNPAPALGRGKKSRMEEIEEADREINTSHLKDFCAVFGL
jgi:hypothetical protein